MRNRFTDFWLFVLDSISFVGAVMLCIVSVVFLIGFGIEMFNFMFSIVGV